MIAITGGAGFIGSALLWHLNSLGRTDVPVIDQLGCNEKWRNVVGRQFLDLIDRDEFLAWLSTHGHQLTALIHLGACTDTTQTDVDYLLRTNFRYSQALWRWAACEHKRFIYASSAATYGASTTDFADGTEHLERLRPLNPYGFSKHCFDLWAWQQQERPSQAVGLKFFNVYGPNEYHKEAMASVVWHAFRQIQAEGKVRLFQSYRADIADGEQQRDFVHVKDVTKLIVWLLEHAGVSGLFNVGSGQARSFRELVEVVFVSLERSPHIEYISMPEALRTRYQYWTCADLRRLRQAGYTVPFTSLEDGVQDYVVQHLSAASPYL